MDKKVHKSRDENLLENLRQIVLENLQNEQFGVEDLAEKIGISRSQLHRKLKKLTKKSISQFIREIRLEKALELLRAQVGTVSEIAYQVGFGSPTYFNTSFRNFFGYPPGEAHLHKDIRAELDEEAIRSDSDSGKKSISKISVKHLWVAFIMLVVGVLLGFLYLYSLGKEKEQQNVFQSESTTSEFAEKSIAVLPFKNLSSSEENSFFCAGVMESILDNLSKIDGLKVISRVSVERYKNSDKTAAEIGKELGVEHLLEGGILRDKYQVRIFVSLVHALDNEQVWSYTYDREMIDIFDVQSEISKRIAQELELQLSTNHPPFDNIGTNELDAYDHYLKGREKLIQYFMDQKEIYYKTALNHFDKALEIDSTMAVVYSDIAMSHWFKYNHLSRDLEFDLYQIKGLCEKALSIDPNLPQAHSILGISKLIEHDESGFRESQLTAIRLNPNYALAYYFLSLFTYEYYQDYNQRLHYINKAMELDPNSIWTPHYYIAIESIYEELHAFEKAEFYAKKSIELSDSGWMLLGRAYLFQGKYEETEELCLKYVDKYPLVYRQLAEIAVNYHRDYDKALELYDKFYDHYPNPGSTDQRLGLAYWLSGDKEKGLELLELGLKEYENKLDVYGVGQCYDIAGIYATLGDKKKALNLLNQDNCILGNGLEYYLTHDALFMNLWDDPEFNEIVRRRKAKKTLIRSQILGN